MTCPISVFRLAPVIKTLLLAGIVFEFGVGTCRAQKCTQDLSGDVRPYGGGNEIDNKYEAPQIDYITRIIHYTIPGTNGTYDGDVKFLYVFGDPTISVTVTPKHGSPYAFDIPGADIGHQTENNYINALCSGQIPLTPNGPLPPQARNAALKQKPRATASAASTPALGSEGTASVALANGSQVVAWLTVDSATLYTAILGADGSTFTTGAQYDTGMNPQHVIGGDFNGDGNADLAVSDFGSLSNNSGGDIRIFLGKGDGTFTPGTSINAGVTPVAMSLADFNGDGKLDLAALNLTANTVSVLLGNGDGTFQAPASYPAAQSPQSIIAADLNGDGKADLAIANEAGNVLILLGNGNGTFQAANAYRGGSGAATYLASTDLNSDGKPDLVVANVSSNAVSFLFGNGDGAFQAPIEHVVGSSPQYFGLLPSADGALIVTVDALAGYPTALEVSNSGIAGSPQMFILPQGPTGVTAADLNGDKLPDIVTANGSISVTLRDPNGTFLNPVSYPLQSGSQAAAVASGDLNGDGHNDVVAASSFTNASGVLGGLWMLHWGTGRGYWDSNTAIRSAVPPAEHWVNRPVA